MSNHNLDLEKSVLATLMNVEDSLLQVLDLIAADDFKAERHKEIYRAITHLDSKSEPYDVMMVSDYLKSSIISSVTDEYLGELLATSSVSDFNLVAYAKRIKEMSVLRKAEKVVNDARNVLDDNHSTNEDKVNVIIEQLTNVLDDEKNQESFACVSDLMEDFFDYIQKCKDGQYSPFIKTGFAELDNKAPLQAGELLIIGARPGMGKTTLAQNIIQSITLDYQKPTVFFSLEMPKAQLMQRLMSSLAEVQLAKTKSGKGLNEMDWGNLSYATEKYRQNFPLFIDDTIAMTIPKMRTSLNKIRKKHGKLGAVLVDYLQLVKPVEKFNNKNDELSEVSKALKAFSKEFDCPVIALAQLNRECEKRGDKRPLVSDLRECGQIEQDADHVWFIYRDEVYNEKSKDKGTAEIIIRKQRNGPIGTVRLGFEGETSRFKDFIPGMDQEDFGGNHA